MDSAETAEFAPDQKIPKTRMNFWGGFPFPVTSTLRVLGVTLDMFFYLDDHYQDILIKAQRRHGILAKVANAGWGLEKGALQMTHDSVITTLLR